MKVSDVRDAYALACRMDRYTQRTDTCWNWIAAVKRANKNARSKAMGYGKIAAVLCNGKQRDFLTHRAAYMLWYGEVPDDKYVLHKCHNPRCVRPDHLRLGTQKDNMDDRMALGRYQRGEEHYNHAVTIDDVVRIRELVAQGIPYAEIALVFGIDDTNVLSIATGKSWAHAPGPIHIPDGRRRFRNTEAKVPSVRTLKRQGWTAPQIAAHVRLPVYTVYDILEGRAYRDIPDD